MSFVNALIIAVLIAMLVVGAVMLFTFMALERLIGLAIILCGGYEEDEPLEDDGGSN